VQAPPPPRLARPAPKRNPGPKAAAYPKIKQALTKALQRPEIEEGSFERGPPAPSQRSFWATQTVRNPVSINVENGSLNVYEEP
jgi:hypothetical protein